MEMMRLLQISLCAGYCCYMRCLECAIGSKRVAKTRFGIRRMRLGG